jgi:PIN domain nuclease of toxin-antitoxin system
MPGRASSTTALQARADAAGLITWTFEHGIAAGRLPLIHRDPFDRLLIAQAQLEELTLVTRDEHIQKYDVDLLVV